MNVAIFGATGMVGQGVLRECLRDARVSRVLCPVRHPTQVTHPKLDEIMLKDLSKLDTIEARLEGLDACFYCVGVSVVGHDEAEYMQLTYNLTLRVATLLLALNPALTFVYVSGAGADPSEAGDVMWARVRGRIENALGLLPFRGAYMFRPGAVQPLHGARAKIPLYNAVYALSALAYPVLARLFPDNLTTTEQMGRAMITVAEMGFRQSVLKARDINSLA